LAVREEAEARAVDPRDPALFVLLGSVGRMLQELRPAEDDPERVHPLGLLLFHIFHFWLAGEPIFLIPTVVLRGLVDAPPEERWSARLPAEAGYLQLPQHLVWMEGQGGERPESVDGFFWTAPVPAGEIHVLLATGLQRERPGFSVVPLPPASLGRAEEWADQPGREGGAEFGSRMPGAEVERLYRVETPGEVLKLVSRIFGFLDRHGSEEGPASGAEEGAPRPSQLPYRIAGAV
jgi:hypothetical protein